MPETLEGAVIAAPTTADMATWKTRISALETSDPERAELEITDALTFSNEMLRAVSDVTAHAPADGAALASAGVGTAKLTAVRAAEFSKRLELSKDTVLEAQMQQRRWERALGVAIREGQERGEIRQSSDGRPRRLSTRKPSASAFASMADLSDKPSMPSIYALADNASDEQFEAALEAARNDGPLDKDGKPRGNVSRANVVRKIKSATEQLAEDGVIDIATGEVIDPEAIAADREGWKERRGYMLGLFTDASMFSDALNRLNSLSDPRRVARYLEVARTARNRPDFSMKHHNPESIRNIAQHLIDYADALEAANV